ncbi:uncharacterized protein LOC143861412 [Tasmannia lanceolata]|uniref:uncharacterized protein LOC143861412 n=1 Tax=Tasmannia lanceolata TaxID=3420 RepID=UPI0040640133
MNIVTSWNIRGICSAAKKKEVQYLIRSTNAPIYCLQETKARESLMMHHVKDICESWDFHGNYEHVIKGRVWILWDPMRVNLQILSESSQFIHAEVLLTQTNQRFHLTTVYGRNYGGDRKVLWEDLELVNAVIQGPWIVLGDFNVIRSYDERSGGPSHNQNDIEDFNNCIHNCCLADLRSIGHSLSWNNRASPSERKYARLDRALVNDLCLQDFPLSFAAYRPPGISDHSAITVSLKNQTSLGPKPFKFMSMWLDDVSVYPVVERAWANNCMGNPMYRLVYKLKEVKRQLVSWNKGIFG